MAMEWHTMCDPIFEATYLPHFWNTIQELFYYSINRSKFLTRSMDKGFLCLQGMEEYPLVTT